MEEEIISIRHISKKFKISKREAGLKNAIKSFFKREYKIINSLEDINFSIKKGENFFRANLRSRAFTFEVNLNENRGGINLNVTYAL